MSLKCVSASLTSVAAGLQRYLQNDCNRQEMWLLKKEDPKFKLFRDALDSRRKRLIASGVGAMVRQADPVTPEDEKTLWDSGVLTSETSIGLSYIVYFYNCKMFGFRARDEHTFLMAEQFKITKFNGKKCLEYYGRLAKNVTGNYESNATPRMVRQFADSKNPRCIVSIFEKYLSLIPANGRFYRKPLANPTRIAFSSCCIGASKLYEYLPKMFKAANIDTSGRNITGHSGKVTCCTNLYAANFDEQAIMTRSGHRSNAVRAYKRPSDSLNQDISDCLQPPIPEEASVSSTTSEESPVSTTQATVVFSPNRAVSQLNTTIIAGNVGPASTPTSFNVPNTAPLAATCSHNANLNDSGVVILDNPVTSTPKPKSTVEVPFSSQSQNSTINTDSETLLLNVPDTIRKVIVLQRGVRLSLELGS